MSRAREQPQPPRGHRPTRRRPAPTRRLASQRRPSLVGLACLDRHDVKRPRKSHDDALNARHRHPMGRAASEPDHLAHLDRHAHLGHRVPRAHRGRFGCDDPQVDGAPRGRCRSTRRPSCLRGRSRVYAWPDAKPQHRGQRRGCARASRHLGWAGANWESHCGWVVACSHHLSEPTTWIRVAGFAGRPGASVVSRMAIVAGDSDHS